MKTRQELEDRIAFLERLNRSLEERIAALEETIRALSRNSSNSSKPPSSDPPGNPAHKAKAKSRKKRKRGGQLGHRGHRREFLKSDIVEQILPSACKGCGRRLGGVDAHPRRVQVVEMPPIKPQVTDFMCHTLTCEGCGCHTAATLPAQARGGTFGPRLSALVALFSGRYRLSKRLTQEFLHDVLGVKIALGSVCNIESRLSSALIVPVKQAHLFVQRQAVVHADETGWRQDKSKAWLWVMACPSVAVFAIAVSRGQDTARWLIGTAFSGVAVTDRWGGYSWLPVEHRQLCWSHLVRDFQSWVDDDGAGAEFGEALLSRTRTMFRWWRKVGDGGMSRKTFAYKMCDLQNEVGRLLRSASACSCQRTAGMATRMLNLEDALWSFVEHDGVQPTNNFGERIIRGAVMWRKLCFGTDSAKGSRFVERIMTTVTTLRLQKRAVLEYLTTAYANSLCGRDIPSLLPDTATDLQLAA